MDTGGSVDGSSAQPSRVQTLLGEILRNPVSAANTQLAQFLSTDNGCSDFVANIRNNNPLAFIYLKQNVPGWLDSHSYAGLYSDEFILFMISVVSERNGTFVCEYLRILSARGHVSRAVLSVLIEKRLFRFLSAVVRKYSEQPRSDPLFLEIKFVIERLAVVLDEIFMDARVVRAVEGRCLAFNSEDAPASSADIEAVSPDFFSADLSFILYYVMCQDIHPYFEDNIAYFFKIFYVLYDRDGSREPISMIYDLFIVKYPDCTNFDLIILTLCKMRRFEAGQIEILTKAYGSVRSHGDRIVELLRRVLPAVAEEDDMETYTRGMLRGVDSRRGAVYRLLQMLGPSPYDFEGEACVFVSTVLRHRDARLIGLCREAIGETGEAAGVGLAFSAFHYLLVSDEFGGCSLGWLETDCKFICLKYLSAGLKSVDWFHTDDLVGRLGLPAQHSGTGAGGFFSSAACSALIQHIFRLGGRVEEFTSELLFRATKAYPGLLDERIFNMIGGAFQKIDRMDLQSVSYFFDIFIAASIKFDQFDLKLIENIFNKEMTDLYCFCFLYLAVLLDRQSIPADFVLRILAQDSLWKQPCYHSGLSVLLIAAYRRSHVTREHVTVASTVLSRHLSTVVLYACGIEKPLAEGDPAVNYIVDGAFDRAWLTENFPEKKFCRLVLKRLAKDRAGGAVDGAVVALVAAKNMLHAEYEFTLHAVIAYFDL